MIVPDYSATHNFFPVRNWGEESNIITLCKEYIGDTHLMMEMQYRDWFTASGGVWIKKTVDNEIVSMIALKCRWTL